MLVIAALTGSCVSNTVLSMRDVSRREGCEALVEKMPYFAEREIRYKRFKDDAKHKIVMLPISFGLGFLANYLLGATMNLGQLAAEGFALQGNEIKAVGLDRVMSYSNITGSRLDDVDDAAIARVTFQAGLCFYENEEWLDAALYFESVRSSIYAKYIGEENILVLLGRCYYMISDYDKSLECYRLFLKIAPFTDFRRSPVKQSIELVETLRNQGLWGIENSE